MEESGWPAALEQDGAALVVHLRAPLDPHEVERVCAALRALMEADHPRPELRLVCQVHGVPDVSVVGALARMTLLARRLQVSLRVRGEEGHLDDLLHLTGLGEVVQHPG